MVVKKLKAINDVDLIVDVPKDAPYYEDLRMLYNAGILVGNDKVGTFQPQTNITRAEFATIMSRMVDGYFVTSTMYTFAEDKGRLACKESVQ